MLGVDYAGYIDPQELKDAGYSFVCRYLSHSAWKNITIDELQDIKDAGLQLVLCWETTESRTLEGYGAGVADAQAARKQLSDLGLIKEFGHSPCVYYAVDTDISDDDLDALGKYFKGVNDTTRGFVGVYGGLKAVSYCLDNNLVQFAWQTAAWSHGKWDTRACLKQTHNDIRTFAGVSCDLDETVGDNYGQVL